MGERCAARKFPVSAPRRRVRNVGPAPLPVPAGMRQPSICGHAFVVLCLVLVAGTTGAFASTRDRVGVPPGSASSRAAPRSLGDSLRRERAETWHWQDVMGVPRTRPFARALASVTRARRLVLVWRERARRAKAQALAPPHAAAWRCIHGYEAGWHAATGNGYYGGLQMDLEFQRTYGRRVFARKGTADHWTPLEQMWTAE